MRSLAKGLCGWMLWGCWAAADGREKRREVISVGFDWVYDCVVRI